MQPGSQDLSACELRPLGQPLGVDHVELAEAPDDCGGVAATALPGVPRLAQRGWLLEALEYPMGRIIDDDNSPVPDRIEQQPVLCIDRPVNYLAASYPSAVLTR